jgi:hypothetical protein
MGSWHDFPYTTLERDGQEKGPYSKRGQQEIKGLEAFEGLPQKETARLISKAYVKMGSPTYLPLHLVGGYVQRHLL